MTKKTKLPEVIPPRSLVRLVKADKSTPLWKGKIGKRYRIGYYSEQDRLDTVWLVDDRGNYCETTDQASMEEYFEVIKISRVKDYFGKNAKPIGAIKKINNRKKHETNL